MRIKLNTVWLGHAYYTTLLVLMILLLLMILFKSDQPIDCQSRWEGEIAALRKDQVGNFYCYRVDYSPDHKKKRPAQARY